MIVITGRDGTNSRGKEMKKQAKLTLFALTAAAIWLGIEVAKIPRPTREDEDYDQGLTTENWSFPTDDGAVLKGKRYVNEGAQPIILAHGFLGNGLEFDLPRRDRNLAVYLARMGYDVWVSSFRGCGREPNICQCRGWLHSIDHLAAYDIPALIEGVTLRTGSKPAWLGHSMGGLTLYMYLQGATFRVVGEDDTFAADPEVAKERNQGIAAAIAIGSPPAFYWAKGGFFGLLTHSRTMRAALKALHRLTGLIQDINPHVRAGEPMARLAARFPRLTAVLINHQPTGWVLYNWDNVEPEVAMSLLRWGGDDVSMRMTMQGLHAIINTDISSYDRSHNYTENMHRITVPFLFVTGSEDAANPATIQVYGYDRVSSEEKKYVNFPYFGHTDLVMGKDVQHKVYPVISDWLNRVLKGSST
jgi:pimeloyl-ACP methyl ester carboxylesterase